MHKKSLLLMALLCVGLGTVYAADLTLDKAIEREARFIIKNSPEDSIVAIVSIKSDSARLSEYIMIRMPDFVVSNNKNITFVERSQLNELQREIYFQYSGEVSEETMVSIGKKIGAQVIITGTIMERGSTYYFNVKLLDVETAKILASDSVNIVHDKEMESFFPNSNVSQAIKREEQAKEQAKEKAKAEKQKTKTPKEKKSRDSFSDGFYVGYLGSLNTPIGISVGGINTDIAFFLDNEVGPPSFKGNDVSKLTYSGNSVNNPPAGNTYSLAADNDTALTWDLIAGVNIKLIKSLLWLNLGAGFEYTQDYRLFTENGSKKVWLKNDTEDNNFQFAVSAGVLVKIWFIYVEGKYKYVFGKELDTSDYGLNHLSLGVGYVWRR